MRPSCRLSRRGDRRGLRPRADPACCCAKAHKSAATGTGRESGQRDRAPHRQARPDLQSRSRGDGEILARRTTARPIGRRARLRRHVHSQRKCAGRRRHTRTACRQHCRIVVSTVRLSRKCLRTNDEVAARFSHVSQRFSKATVNQFVGGSLVTPCRTIRS